MDRGPTSERPLPDELPNYRDDPDGYMARLQAVLVAVQEHLERTGEILDQSDMFIQMGSIFGRALLEPEGYGYTNLDGHSLIMDMRIELTNDEVKTLDAFFKSVGQ